MAKLRNKIVLVFLALCLVACMGIMVACGGDDAPEDKSVTYTVTVTAGDAAAQGVQVTIKKGAATIGKPATTDGNGKATFKLAEDAGYTVALSNLPVGYELAEGATLTFDADKNLVVGLTEKFAYKVKLVNPDGTAFTANGVTVGICTVEDNPNCLNPVAIGADGVAKVYDAAKTNYHIKVAGLPAGYAYESDAEGYSVYLNDEDAYVLTGANATYTTLTATKTETSITVYPVNVIDVENATALTQQELDAYLDNKGLWIEGAKAYKKTVELEAGETAYYALAADYDCEYTIYVADESAEYKVNPVYLLGDTALNPNYIFNPNGQLVSVTADDDRPYYLNVTNTGDETITAEFIVTTPVSSATTVAAGGTVKTVVNKEGKNAVITIEPNKGTTYRLTVQGDGAVRQTSGTYWGQNIESFSDDDYTDSKVCTVKYTEDMTGDLYFAVSIKADEYPATLNVKVEKIGTHTNTTTVVTNAALKPFAYDPFEENTELMPVAQGATLVKGDDGYYHIGSKTGNLVVVVLTAPIGNYNNGIIYLEMANNGVYSASHYIIDVTTAADKAAADKGNSYKDYRRVLRGFDEYKTESTTGGGVKLTIPADKDVNEYYADNVNCDGAYPLDDVLKEFLEGLSAKLGEDPLFACYYYVDYVEPDEIVDTYTSVDDSYTLTVDKWGTFKLVDSYSTINTGSWSKTGNVYSFTCDNTMFHGVLTYADGTFTYSDDFDTVTLKSEWPAESVDAIVGEYKVSYVCDENGNESSVDDDDISEDDYKLIVNKNGTFEIQQYSEMQGYKNVYYFAGECTWSKVSGDYTFVIAGGGLDSEGEVCDLTFTVIFDADSGEITLIGDDNVTVWTFMKGASLGDDEEEDPEPDFATLYSNETLGEDNPAATLGLYNNGDCKLWRNQYNGPKKIAEATWSANQDGSNVQITNVTAIDDGIIDHVEATYNNGTITVTIVYLDEMEMEDTVYTFTMQA